jgi:hypothetical protein
VTRAVRLVEARHRIEQHARIGVLRCVENRFRRAFLDIDAVLHHLDAVGHARHHAHIVGDQGQRRTGIALQLVHDVQHFGLDRHVERGGRFVADQQVRFAQHRHGDHDALPHTAGEFVRILFQAARRLGDAHPVEPFQRALFGSRAVHLHVNAQHFLHLGANAHVRRERGQRVLENHRHVTAAHTVQLARRQAEDFLVAILDRALGLAVRGQQTHRREEGLALARARLADHRQALAGIDLQRHALDRIHSSIRRIEGHRQVGNLQYGRSILADASCVGQSTTPQTHARNGGAYRRKSP